MKNISRGPVCSFCGFAWHPDYQKVCSCKASKAARKVAQPSAPVVRREVCRPYTVEILEAEIALRKAGDARIELATEYRLANEPMPESEWQAAYDAHRQALEHLVAIKYYQD